MRKMQEAADEGKVGKILKMITGNRPPFSLDCSRVGEKNITDAWEPQINGVVTTLKTTIEHLEKRGHAVKVVHPGMFKLTVPLQP